VEKRVESGKWSVEGALSVIATRSLICGDIAFASGPEVVESANKFLKRKFSSKDISEMIRIKRDRMNGPTFPPLS